MSAAHEKFAEMSIGELLEYIDGNAADRILATMFYMAKCAREMLETEGVDPAIIDRVVSKLTPGDPDNVVS